MFGCFLISIPVGVDVLKREVREVDYIAVILLRPENNHTVM
jgi:hypothetical protein